MPKYNITTNVTTNAIIARNWAQLGRIGADTMFWGGAFDTTRPDVLPMDADYTIGDCVAALYDSTYRALVQRGEEEPNLLTVYHGPARAGGFDTFVGTSADLDSWDPFASDDGWPGPAVGGYSCYVSPFVPLAEAADMAYYGNTGPWNRITR